MTAEIEQALERWREAGLADAAILDRIAAFERERTPAAFEPERTPAAGLHWPVILALVFGGLLVGAGVLLFVAAHWDTLSPAQRVVLVVLMVAVFHVAGALTAARWETLAMLLHGLGTVALGAGIYLFGQIFNMQEHWPAAVALWAAGAWAGWLLRRDWLQMSFAAVLTPAWLLGEWVVRFEPLDRGGWIAADAAMILASVYLSARVGTAITPIRRALVWIGGLALLPCAAVLLFVHSERALGLDPAAQILGWVIASALSLAVAFVLRRGAAWMNAAAAAAVIVLALLAATRGSALEYLWCALMAAGLAAWGVYERRSERINLGIAGFALTVLFFYFSELMDKLDRSVSLIVLGLVCLGGGWALERTRRRLVAGTRES
jgi:uncharacterized membrane protein